MTTKELMKDPLVVTLVVVIVFVILLMAFSAKLPPISVVESGSMQHSDVWLPGTINTGDMIMQKKVANPLAQVTTYVQGRTSNISSYGDYGNVIMYISSSNISIVHRAMFYLEWNGSIPVVLGYTNQSWLNVSGDTVVIKDVGFNHRTLVVYLDTMVGKSGFITMGDNNLGTSDLLDKGSGGYVAADQNILGFMPICCSSVTGIAFGQIPWLGLIKLNILGAQGQWDYSNDVPKFSYLYLSMASAATLTSLGISAYALERHEEKREVMKQRRH